MINQNLYDLEKYNNLNNSQPNGVNHMIDNLIEKLEKLKNEYNNIIKLQYSNVFENSNLNKNLTQVINVDFQNLEEKAEELTNNLKSIECQKYENTYNNISDLIEYLKNKFIVKLLDKNEIIERTIKESYNEYSLQFQMLENNYIIHVKDAEMRINNFQNTYSSYNPNTHLTKNINHIDNIAIGIQRSVELVENDIIKMKELLEKGLKKIN